MPDQNKDWFIGERSEALANVLLRSRNDIQIRDEHKVDYGADFLVDVNQDKSRWQMLFVVQVKGTLSSDSREWLEGAKQVYKLHDRNLISMPTCLFMTNVRDRKSFFAWVAEPLIENEDTAVLMFKPPSAFAELDQKAVDGIVDQVRKWYQIVPQQFAPKVKES